MLGGDDAARNLAEEQTPVLTPNLTLNNPSNSATTGDFTVTGGTLNQDYAYSPDDSGVLTIKTSKPLTIQNTNPSASTKNRIQVPDGVTANVTLSGVNIDTSSLGEYKRAFKLMGTAVCNLTLADGTTNTLKSSKFSAGLQVETYQGKTAMLNIGGTGTLKAYGGPGGSGIGGGGFGSEGGNITINSGTVEAYSGSKVSHNSSEVGGAAIGGGPEGGGGTIRIKGGTVTAQSNDGNGAGIGTGKFPPNGKVTKITISGGTVNATSTYAGDGAGIGSGQGGGNVSPVEINISGGIVNASGYGGAAIGGGTSQTAGTIVISGGIVTATSHGYSAGIGAGYCGNGGSITISGGTVVATGSGGGAGIGNGASSSGTTFSTTSSGQAFISASSISDKKEDQQWNGLIFDGKQGKIYGDSFTLKTDAAIPSGKTLTVDTGKTLTVAPDKTLTVGAGGSLNVGKGGTLDVGAGGTLTNKGSVTVTHGGALEAAEGGVSNSGTLNKADQQVDSVTVTPLTVNYGAAAPVITPVNAAGGVDVVYSAVSNTSGSNDTTDVASVSGQTITVNKPGTFYVKAVIAGNYGYNEKTVYSAEITVSKSSSGGNVPSGGGSSSGGNVPSGGGSSSGGNVPGGGSSSGSHVPSGGSSGGGGGASSGGGSHDQGDASAANTVVIPQTMVPKQASPFAHAASAFTDIENSGAKADIEFVVDRGLLLGTSDTQFSPDTLMTRGMFITVLGRLAGIDPGAYSSSASFQDVSSSDYYAPYVIWGTGKGVVAGMSQTTFAPDQPISYQEMAVMLSNYVKAMNAQLPQTHQETPLSDNSAVADWAAEAVRQMESAGVLGKEDTGAFDPAAGVTRAEAASALHQFVKDIQTK